MLDQGLGLVSILMVGNVVLSNGSLRGLHLDINVSRVERLRCVCVRLKPLGVSFGSMRLDLVD